MNYQSIRARLEGPLLTIYNGQAPAIPVYFDNITFVPPDPPKEYVRVNVTFGVTTESTIAGTLDYARGSIVIRCFSSKSSGPARCQQLVAMAKQTLDTMNSATKTGGLTYVRTSNISGPSFTTMEEYPHFIGRIEAAWQASVK